MVIEEAQDRCTRRVFLVPNKFKRSIWGNVQSDKDLYVPGVVPIFENLLNLNMSVADEVVWSVSFVSWYTYRSAKDMRM